ncbi:hypothetical protein FQ192_01075 [Pseudomonas sp. ANT_J12]|nr:hypothetical protein FQ192_01075 [Pseudomonas sp. ANT_J12]
MPARAGSECAAGGEGRYRAWRRLLIIPTLCVGMQPVTLCVTVQERNAERPKRHSHAERGNDFNSQFL